MQAQGCVPVLPLGQCDMHALVLAPLVQVRFRMASASVFGVRSHSPLVLALLGQQALSLMPLDQR